MPRRTIHRLQEHLERAFRSNAWHGPALMETLHGVTAEQAAPKPLAGAHSIWEYVLHCATWIHVAQQFVVGNVKQPSSDEDWPPINDTSAAAWERVLMHLEDEHRRLLDALQLVDDTILSQTVPTKNYDFYTLLHGVAEHNIYHAGQIMLLRRALENAREQT
jgi:uncharacterized damage-inducible protein DinB